MTIPRSISGPSTSSVESLVGVVQDETLDGYSGISPYSPKAAYPEYPFDPAEANGAPGTPHDGADGRVYDLVRRALMVLGLDREHAGSAAWNPLGGIVRPGDVVVVKPNLVMHRHGWGWDPQSVITHGSVVRAVLDYVRIALQGRGKIIVGDAPIQAADFSRLAAMTGLDEIVRFHRAQGTDISLVDFRLTQSTFSRDGAMGARHAIGGDPAGSTRVALGGRSWLAPLAAGHERFRVTNYDPREMSQHHNTDENEYLVANSILRADVVINIPKMKTHRKVGLTSALKNLVGINAHKDWLPHHRQGSASEGGDEYLHTDAVKAAVSRLLDRENSSTSPAARRMYYYPRRALGVLLKLTRRDPFFEGSWYGNDTAWRMCLDLNRILLYASKTGEICDTPERRVFTIVDGVIAGEGEGPLEPTSRPVGLIVAGSHSPAVDAVIARLMGFDYRKIPLIRESLASRDLPLIPSAAAAIRVVSDSDRWDGIELTRGADSLRFEPPAGWKGHIELAAEPVLT
jgi:uncharacterized protein (DUF362 family)